VALVGPKVVEPGDAHGGRDSAQLVFPIDLCRALMMVRQGMPPLPSRMPTEADAAVVMNLRVAFNAYRHIIRQPGTDPLAGITVPRRATSSFSIGAFIAFQPTPRRRHAGGRSPRLLGARGRLPAGRYLIALQSAPTSNGCPSAAPATLSSSPGIAGTSGCVAPSAITFACVFAFRPDVPRCFQ
jgi:hypothetical protein